MTRVARPTTISNRTLNRLILLCGLALVIGAAAFAIFYWNDRHVDPGAPLADRTVVAAEAAVQANPNDVQARDHLAAAYVAANRLQDGIAQFTAALGIDPADRPALLGRGIAYIQSEQPDLAAADLQKLIDAASKGEFAATDPQLEHAYYELGVAQILLGQDANAVPNLEKALAIDGTDADALYSLGTALVQTGDPAKAVLVLRLATAFVPTQWCEPFQKLVEAYTALHQPDGVAWAGAMVAFCQGRLDEATTALQPLTAGAMKTDALLGLALVAGKRGDNAAAEGYYRQVLEIDPTNQSASIGLSMLGADASTAPSPVASPSAGGSN
jgi:tetratricopeptide (TPR) repeat protein